MRILHVIASVDPAGGGPIEYARLMADAHAALGHSSRFATLDTPDDPAVTGFAHPVACPPGDARGAARAPAFSALIRRIAGQVDVAVIHGLWNVSSFAGYRGLRAAGTPWVVFPHGMLDPYFRRAKPAKHLLKQAVWTAWQGRMLSGAAGVLFTCAQERRLARAAFRGHRTRREQVVAFCAADQGDGGGARGAARFRALLPALGNRPYLLFLSRIHPKKACDDLLAAYGDACTSPETPDLVLAGPDEAGWTAELRRLAEARGLAGRVHWPGMITGPIKAAAYAGAQAFVLPSHQENFGLVVAEALSARTPVLISDKVNIWREVVDAGAGAAAPDTREGTAAMLRSFLALDAAGKRALASHARPCYERHFSVRAASDSLLAVLEQASACREAAR